MKAKSAHPNSLGRPATAVGVMLTVLFAGLIAPAHAATSSHGAASVDSQDRTLRVVLVEQKPVFGSLNNTKPGGVALLEEPAVVNGKSAGDSLTRLQFLKGGSFLLDCTVRLTGKGNLDFSGGEEAANLAKKTTFAVTGGTGVFSGTGGHVDITPTKADGKNADLLTFHLQG